MPVPLTVSPAILAPSITATKVDTYPSAPGGAQPGEIITYSVTITNSGPDPATNVTLSDTVDVNTAIVGHAKVHSHRLRRRLRRYRQRSHPGAGRRLRLAR